MKLLILLSLIASITFAQLPNPTDTNTWPTVVATNVVPYPPRSRPPVMPYKGNIREMDNESITFWNDVTSETEPLEVLWIDDLGDTNGWSVIGSATNNFQHNNPDGFYRVKVDELKFVEVDREN